MPDLHSILKLASLRSTLPPDAHQKGPAKLREITAFGSNPGALRAWLHVPAIAGDDAPLVVVLHGCTQNAEGYDVGAGWSQLADELGFVVLLPEQQRANNPNLCFNWFSPIDSRRDSGEALSIRQMIDWVAEAHDIDPRRVFVTGLSAGGAMASIMLAAYPELFAGGAIVAGLPFGAAGSVGEAFSRMAGQGYPDDAQLAALVREASAHDGPWPAISVWHGSADTTVHPSNAERIIGQWRSLHGVDDKPAEQEQSGGHIRRLWRNAASQPVLDHHLIMGMGHGTPLKTQGPDGCGKPGPFMLEVGISSTRAIAQSWGLFAMGEAQAVALMAASIATVPTIALPAFPPIAKGLLHRAPAKHPHKGVGAVIEEALRAAGLMK